jgi:flagellar basal-body rod modification protein FlgD
MAIATPTTTTGVINTPNAIAGTGTGTSASTVSTSGKAIAENFTQFLTLLTTQLKNQNPLEPLNTNEFTQQLVQFASVEQQLKSNQTLDSLLKSTQTANTTAALGFVGMQITADGVVSSLSKGEARWQLQAPRGGTATINIKNSAGQTVFSAVRQLDAGSQSFLWDGKMPGGVRAVDGDYSVAIEAKDVTGQPMTVGVEMSGIVNGVAFGPEGPVLRVGSASVPMNKVKSLRKPP